MLGDLFETAGSILSRTRRGTPGAIGLLMADHLAFLLRLRGCVRLRLALRLWDVRRRIRRVVESSGLLQLDRNIEAEFLGQSARSSNCHAV
jgi:hypothetical protein